MVSRDSELRQLRDDYASLDDRLLVLDFQAGHPEAFVEIHSRYSGLARSVCRRMLVNEHDADEAFQETMIRIFQGLHRFNGQYALRPWISRVATNVSIDAIRARDRRPAIDESPVEEHDRHDPADGPEQAVERLVDRDIVISVLSELPESHRTALVLRELEGRSHKEIGQSLGITPSQAKALIHRAKTSFRRGWFQTMAERGGVMGIALLPLLWAVKAFEGARRIADKIGGHAVQVAQAATPEVVSSTAASPAVTVVAGMSERVVAAGMAVLLAGGVTVGAAKLADRNKDKEIDDPCGGSPHRSWPRRPKRWRRSSRSSGGTTTIARRTSSPTPRRFRPERSIPTRRCRPPPTRGSRHRHRPRRIRPEPGFRPQPRAAATPPARPGLVVRVPVLGRFRGDVRVRRLDTASNARTQALESGGFSFSQVIKGGVRDAGGDVTWPFSLQQWGQVNPLDGQISYAFRLSSVAGPFLYRGSGSLAETTQNADGSTTYRFEGSFERVAHLEEVPGLPTRGFTSVTIGVWQDGTIFTGSFAVEDATS